MIDENIVHALRVVLVGLIVIYILLALWYRARGNILEAIYCIAVATFLAVCLGV